MTERSRRWRSRKKAEGLVQVRVWVPEAEAPALLAAAESLRPVTVEIDGECVEPTDDERAPSERMLKYAARLAERHGTEILPAILHNHNRLCAWISRNLRQPSWIDERYAEKRRERIAKLQAELDALTSS